MVTRWGSCKPSSQKKKKKKKKNSKPVTSPEILTTKRKNKNYWRVSNTVEKATYQTGQKIYRRVSNTVEKYLIQNLWLKKEAFACEKPAFSEKSLDVDAYFLVVAITNELARTAFWSMTCWFRSLSQFHVVYKYHNLPNMSNWMWAGRLDLLVPNSWIIFFPLLSFLICFPIANL